MELQRTLSDSQALATARVAYRLVARTYVLVNHVFLNRLDNEPIGPISKPGANNVSCSQ